MSLMSFVKKLLPRIERSTVAEDLRITEKEVNTVNMPSWAAAAVHFKVNRPVSPKVKDLTTAFYRNFKPQGGKAPTLFSEISKVLPWLLANIQTIERRLDQVVEKDIIPDAITAKAAYLVRAAGHMSMISRYLGSLLNYLYAAEAEHMGHGPVPGLEIAKAERLQVEKNFELFAKLLNQYARDPKQFEKTVISLPEIYVSQEAEAGVTALYQGQGIDPLEQVGVAGFVGSAIYSFRMVIARWQQDRYEASVAKKQQLEMRLLYLQMQANGEEDPTVENEIRILQDRIEKLEYKIRAEEERYGVHAA